VYHLLRWDVIDVNKIKPNQLHPSEELLEKVRHIAFVKSMVSLAYRGEFNKFGVYVQSKDIYEQDFTKTIYMAGGKFIPKLKFTDISRDLPVEVPEDIYADLDLADPDYLKKADQRCKDYLSKCEFSKFETIVNKYEPGDWEGKLDLLHKFTQEFEEKYRGLGQEYP